MFSVARVTRIGAQTYEKLSFPLPSIPLPPGHNVCELEILVGEVLYSNFSPETLDAFNFL